LQGIPWRVQTDWKDNNICFGFGCKLISVSFEYNTTKGEFILHFFWILFLKIIQALFQAEVGAQIKNFNTQAQIVQPKFLIGKTQAQIAQVKNKVGNAQAQIAKENNKTGKTQAQIAQLFSKI